MANKKGIGNNIPAGAKETPGIQKDDDPVSKLLSDRKRVRMISKAVESEEEEEESEEEENSSDDDSSNSNDSKKEKDPKEDELDNHSMNCLLPADKQEPEEKE